MKHLSILFTSCLLNLTSSAAVPLRWTVETSSANPATFDQFAGATYDLEATLQSRGKPLAVTGDPQLFWQTNGMGSAWWTSPATVSGNVLRATWTPACDVGAKVYNCFIGITGTVYNAAFQLRLRPSPGAMPNELPLPQKVINFSRVTVLNPPWPSGAARPLPKYLHMLDFDDSYPDDAAAYYRSRGNGKVEGGCSAVRDGGFLYRNFDFPLDERAEFVVKMAAGTGRFSSVGVAQVGTNLTEQMVTSGKPSRWYKSLPGATTDGINENGIVCEINVVDCDPQWRSGVLTASDIHPLAAVRWVLDNATSAGMAASNLVARIMFPSGWKQNFHWMLADSEQTWIVENGTASNVTAVAAKRVMTNFEILTDDYTGMGEERYEILRSGGSITNAWYTNAYSPSANWASEFKDVAEQNVATNGWASLGTKDARRAIGKFWQTLHTSVYDISNRTLRVAVQETDDWYVFQVPVSKGYTKAETDEKFAEVVGESTNAAIRAVSRGFRRLHDEHVYVPAVMGPFNYEADDFPGLVDAIGDRQPEEYSYGSDYSEYYLYFPYDDYDVNAYGYGRTTDDIINFNGYGYRYDPATGDYETINVYFLGRRDAREWIKTDDTFARESAITQVRSDVIQIRNMIGSETKVMRQDGEFEYGSGWGYVRQVMDSDRRMWRIRVPKWTGVAGMTTNAMDAATSYFVRTNANYHYCTPSSPYPNAIMQNVISWYEGWGLDRKLVTTAGISGSDGTAYADYRIGIFYRDADNRKRCAIEYDVTQTATAPMSFKVKPVTDGLQTTRSCRALGNNTQYSFGIRYLDLPDFSRTWSQTYSSTYSFDITMTVHFIGLMVEKDAEVQTTNGTIPLTYWLLCDCSWHIIRHNLSTGVDETLDKADNEVVIPWTVTVTANSYTTMEDLIVPYYRLLSTRDPNLYYDRLRDETFRISVSNGCFYSEKFMDGDWRKAE